MRVSAFLRIIASVSMLAVVAVGPLSRFVGAQDPEIQARSEKALRDAAAGLRKALDTPPVKRDPLWTSAQPFMAAAQDSQNRQALKRATEDLQRTLDDLKKDPKYEEGTRTTAAAQAVKASLEYQAVIKPPASPSPGSPSPSPPTDAGTWAWSDLIFPAAAILAGIALIVLTVFGVQRLRRGYWDRFYHHVSRAVKANTTELMQRQDELVKHMNALAGQHRSGAARLESIEGELQALGRRARALSDGGGYQSNSNRQSVNDYSRPQPTPVEPEFPTSVDEYLNKMKRNSTVVKPDFQNGILVNDLDGRGELVLVRDTRLADDAQPLFLVPRVGQFQTKQEFHSYYERYYECQKPSAGNVWIIDPAVVSTVPGGWELREKGVLEVR